MSTLYFLAFFLFIYSTNGSIFAETIQITSPTLPNPSTDGSLFSERLQNTNVTAPNPDLIFFNRVPKVGSTMMMNLLRRLSIRNGFAFFQDAAHPGMQARLNCAQEADLTHLLCQLPKQPPSVYIKHVAMVNFTRGGVGGCNHVVYINMVRDPVERMISWYYYIRLNGTRNFAARMKKAHQKEDDTWLQRVLCYKK